LAKKKNLVVKREIIDGVKLWKGKFIHNERLLVMMMREGIDSKKESALMIEGNCSRLNLLGGKKEGYRKDI
jgi:hypothetical protein